VAALQDEHAEGNVVGLNLATGEAMDPTQEGVYDSFRVLRNCIASATGIASNLLLCDEMLKARQMVSRYTDYRTTKANQYLGTTTWTWRRGAMIVSLYIWKTRQATAAPSCEQHSTDIEVRKMCSTSR
jgi:hypothetical protein